MFPTFDGGNPNKISVELTQLPGRAGNAFVDKSEASETATAQQQEGKRPEGGFDGIAVGEWTRIACRILAK